LLDGRLPARTDHQPDEIAAFAAGSRGRVTGRARAQLLAALAEVGVEPEDYALIEQARALVDDVNARLRARKSTMIYTVTFWSALPLRSSDGAAVPGAGQQPEVTR
jgi:hypothetical protein